MGNQSTPVKQKIRRLYYDLEVSPNVVLAWRAGYDLSIPYDSIISERKIICIGYLWDEDVKPHVLTWDKNQDDKELLKEFVEIANQADELVAHFGDRFDIKWFRTRCLFHKLPPLPDYKTIDTKSLASKLFYFNSNKLNYLSDFLGHGKKLETKFDLWKDILLHNDKDSLAYMAKYCGIDCVRLRSVHRDLAKYAKPKTHAGVLAGGDKWQCPRTGTTNVIKSKTRVTAAGTIAHQMKSLVDGSYFQISDTAYRSYLAAKKKPTK